MNKTQKTRIKSKIASLVKLSMQITEDTDHDMFFDYSGHVNQFSVDIHIGGWDTNRNRKEIFQRYIRGADADESNSAVFDDMFSKLSLTEITLKGILEIGNDDVEVKDLISDHWRAYYV